MKTYKDIYRTSRGCDQSGYWTLKFFSIHKLYLN